MSVPTDLDKYQGWLALDEDQLKEEHLPVQTIERVIRFRALYTYWCRFSSKAPRDIVEYDTAMFKVSESQAYDDVHCLKVIIGNLQESSKKFWRWRINQMIEEGKITADQAKIGYIGAYPYAEVKSGYTSFFLGARSVCPKKIPDLRVRIKKFIKKYDKEAEFADFVEIPATDNETAPSPDKIDDLIEKP